VVDILHYIAFSKYFPSLAEGAGQAYIYASIKLIFICKYRRDWLPRADLPSKTTGSGCLGLFTPDYSAHPLLW